MIIRPSNPLYEYFIPECIYLCVGKAISLPTVISQCGEVDKAWNGGHSVSDVMEDNPDASTLAAYSM